MMLYLAFAAACALLIAIPGPNVALIVANSVAWGTRFGLLTVAGTSAAVAVHMALTVYGMAGLLGLLADWFDWLRWAGAAYLVAIGVLQWRAPVADLAGVRAQPRAPRAILLRGFLVGLTNPKTLLFYGAFFPQFLTPGEARPQLAILAAIFLTVAVVLDAGWAIAAGRMRFLLGARPVLRNRLSGGLLIGAGIGLALARRR